MRIPKSAGFDAEIGLLQIAKLGFWEIGRKKIKSMSHDFFTLGRVFWPSFSHCEGFQAHAHPEIGRI